MCAWTFIDVNADVSSALEYSGTVWVFTPVSGLLLLHADGSIVSIHNHLALSLFGYSKDELLGKVSQRHQLNMDVCNEDHQTLMDIAAVLSSAEHHFPDAWILRLDVGLS